MARRDGPVLELLLQIDRGAAEPLHLQLERQLRDAIRDGRLRPGAAVPSTRSLASDLGVARALVVDVYSQLAAEGYLHPSRGSGTAVAARGRSRTGRVSARATYPAADYDFHPGMPDLASFPIVDWSSCAQRALRTNPDVALGYADPQGLPVLREVLAEYLARTRGATADPDSVVICDGLTQGLALVCRALRGRGARRVAVEDPGFGVHRKIIAHVGLEPVPIPVDEDGLRVDALARQSVDAVVVTAAHQFPTGYALSAERRAALVNWATETGGIVIEDDYDGQYRYDARPAGAIQRLAVDHVVYAGTASKILAPGLRVGWLLLPAAMTRAVVLEKVREDLGSNAPTQLTLARFIEQGHLDRHLRRVRMTYRARRDALVDALATDLPDARIQGIAAGLHALVLLPDRVNEADLRDRAMSQGVAVCGLREFRATAEPRPPGLVLGYACLPEAKINEGVQKIALAAMQAIG